MRIKTLCLLAIGLLAVLFNACKKDDPDNNKTPKGTDCPTCIYDVEALESLDSSSAGVYKAMIIGSSGSIRFYLHNGNVLDTGYIIFDGHFGQLTTQSLTGWNPGEAIDSALFTGTVNGVPVQVYFSVDEKGKNPQVWCHIPGHDVVAAVAKETGYAIQGYEGRYYSTVNGVEDTSGEKGTFCILRYTGRYIVLMSNIEVIGITVLSPFDFITQKDHNNVSTHYEGGVVGDTIMSGKWKAVNGNRGDWEVRRTM